MAGGSASRVRIGQVLVVATALLGLEIGPRVIADPIAFVPLSEVFKSGLEAISSGTLVSDFAATLGAYLVSGLLIVVLGVPLGVLLRRFPRIRRAVQPYMTIYYALPVFVFYPVLLALLGFNLWPIVVIAWLWGVVAVILNTAAGFDQVPDVLIKLGQSLNLSRRAALKSIYLPAAAPYIFTGIKIGISYALIGVVAAEFVISNRGLGYSISYNYVNFGVDKMYVGIYSVFLLALVANLLFSTIERRAYRHAYSQGK